MDRLRLKRIARELLEMAGELDAEHAADERSATDRSNDVSANPEDLIAMARFIRGQRKLRHKYFKRSLFGEPAWGMMLELFIAEHVGAEISTTSLCLASDVPATTAHRYIAILIDSGLIVRQPHAKDQRQAVVHLSSTGRTAMTEYLNACIGLAPDRPAAALPADAIVELVGL